MVFAGLQKDIKSFVSGRDLVIFAITLALSTQFQATLKSIIDNMIMPFVSSMTGASNLATRSWDLRVPTPGSKDPVIKLTWGAALQSIIVFFITLIIMVKTAKYLTVHYVKSSSVSFN